MPATPEKKKRPTVEEIKSRSGYLRGDLREQFEAPTSAVSDEAYQLLKFSGMYQQDDRDQRQARRQQRLERAYSFMVRTKLPSGILSAEQYLAHDALAGRVGNGTLRFTTRQGIQLHGVHKGDVKPLLQELDRVLVTSLAACGDVVRNVMACPAPSRGRPHALVQELAREIERRFLPRSDTYYDLWLDGERAETERATFTPAIDEIEPIYGRTYLPRKFKIGIALPDDNCVDVFTQDIGIVPVLDGEELRGFNILVGGGLGMSHTSADTFPRLGSPLGFVKPDEILDAVEVIVTIQRDHGNREDRKRSRMKYLVHDWGIDRFREVFTARFGRSIGAWVGGDRLEVDDHLGWRAQGDGRYSYGIPVENGRIKDVGAVRLRTGLRAIARAFGTELRITPQHDLLVTDLGHDQQAHLLAILREHGIRTKDEISQARRHAIACPALPTCGLALAESERVMPSIIDGIEAELDALGLAGERIAIRMTGCPNGCARPYTAELAFVGRSPDLYNVYVGGSFEGHHLVEEYDELVHLDDLVATVRPLFELWRRERRDGEGFGDFCRRSGVGALRARAARLPEGSGCEPVGAAASPSHALRTANALT